MEVHSPTKSALLIGPTYDHLSEKLRLQGTLNDVEIMKEIISKPPFNFNSIKEVTGLNATHSNILESFAEISNEAPPNSVVLIYYSGHGETVKGQEEGHYDEGLVPADANHGNIDTLCITGEALTTHLEKLSKKNVATTVIFDCCYSGHMYRGADCDNPNFQITAVKQVDFILRNRADPTENDDFSYSYPVQETWIGKWQKEGWRPTDTDKFVYISACNSNQYAYEGVCNQTGKTYGLLTYILANILKKVAQEEKQISYEVLFSLIRKDCLQQNIEVQRPQLITKQIPQLEGGEFGTLVFDVKTVKLRPKTIVISKVLVIGKVVEMRAGRLQLMDDGEYDVFKAEVPDEEGLKSRSEYWVGTVDVNQGDIGITTSRGYICEELEFGAIKPGCVVRLAKPGSMRTDIVIVGSGDSSERMKSEVEKTKMFNIREHRECNTDYILEVESVNREQCWCARRWGQMTVPPVYPGEEALMAENMAKDARYKMVRKLTLSDSSPKLDRVFLKIVQVQEVEPFHAFRKYRLIDEALKNNEDLYEAGALGPSPPTFRAHKVVETEVEGNKKIQAIDRSGDGLVIRVTNDEEHPIHICILFLQLDGSIVALYPKKKGHTIELRAGRSADEIVRMYIPKDSLRLYHEPDPTKDEPHAGIDTIMLLAATESCEFEPLLQSEIVFGGAKGKEKEREGEKPRCEQLNPLEKFRKALCCRNGPEQLDGSTPGQWLVTKRAFWLQKNSDS